MKHDKTDTIIFGTSKVAQIVFASIMDDSDTDLNPIAFCVDHNYYVEDTFLGLPVVKFEEVCAHFTPDKYCMLIAIGYHQLNHVRAEKCLEAIEKGYKLVSFIHSKADVSQTASIGNNCIILRNVTIGPFANIRNNICIYSNATVAHHTEVMDNVWITSGTTIGGNTKIGNNCFLGINATIGHNIKIGKDNFIGAGAIVTKNTEDESVYIVPDTPKYRINTKQFLKLFKFD